MTEVNELAKALSAAQAEMENAKMNGTNPHFNSKFADLAAIREATLPTLTKHGLCITQPTRYTESGTLLLVTRLMHTSGQFIEGEYPIAVGKPQDMGSALTYAKRYCWSGITGIAADEDDDAQAAQNAPKAAPKKAPVPTEAPEGGQGKDIPPPPVASVPDENQEVTRMRRRWKAVAKGQKPSKTEESEGAAICDRWSKTSLDELDAGEWEAEIEALKAPAEPAPLGATA